SSVLMIGFGPSRMYFHMIQLPGSHPLRDEQTSYALAFLRASFDLFRSCLNALGMIALALVIGTQIGTSPASGPRAWISARPWSLLAMIAVFLVPSSIIPYMKVGGFVNTLACSHYFFALAACGALEDVHRTALPSLPILARSIQATLFMLTLLIGINFLAI